MNEQQRTPLERLARYCGIKLDYWDFKGIHRKVSAETLLAVLRAYGVAMAGPNDAAAALVRQRLARWREPIAPVHVSWKGRPGALRIRLPAAAFDAALQMTIEFEDGDSRSLAASAADLVARAGRSIAGEEFLVRDWPLPDDLPIGFHRLTLDGGGKHEQAHLFVAPLRAWQPGDDAANGGAGDRAWGTFLPLYAMRRGGGRGAADWSDLGRFVDWTAARGGAVAATLPMLAGFLGNGPNGDEAGPFEYSPYSPASRLFLNELFIDPAAVPEMAISPEARALLDAPEMREAFAELNVQPLVDYRRQAALQRRILERLAAAFFGAPPEAIPERRAAFDRFLVSHPQAEDYALFRGVVESQKASWHTWPVRQRLGRIETGDADPAAVRYHLYAQFIACEQLHALAARARAGGNGLYLDMPLGVGGDSYDVWRHRKLFAMEASGGAPPDGFFSKGQNWGFPPMHPAASRAEGHAYFIKSLRRLMECAGSIRIDHVMGLHRLYWVPHGFSAAEGAYVRYPHDEYYAILTILSQRQRVQAIGENLGTVPAAVDAAMALHGVSGMYVMQFGTKADGGNPFEPVPAGAVASLNTHDTPTFAAWWHGLEFDLQLELGLIDEDEHRESHLYRGYVRDSIRYYFRQRGLLGAADDSLHGVMAGALHWLAASPAGLVLVNIEDLWLEELPQNVPGTGPWERPNWRRRAALPFETWKSRPEYYSILARMNDLRKSSAEGG